MIFLVVESYIQPTLFLKLSTRNSQSLTFLSFMVLPLAQISLMLGWLSFIMIEQYEHISDKELKKLIVIITSRSFVWACAGKLRI